MYSFKNKEAEKQDPIFGYYLVHNVVPQHSFLYHERTVDVSQFGILYRYPVL